MSAPKQREWSWSVVMSREKSRINIQLAASAQFMIYVTVPSKDQRLGKTKYSVYALKHSKHLFTWRKKHCSRVKVSEKSRCSLCWVGHRQACRGCIDPSWQQAARSPATPPPLVRSSKEAWLSENNITDNFIHSRLNSERRWDLQQSAAAPPLFNTETCPEDHQQCQGVFPEIFGNYIFFEKLC